MADWKKLIEEGKQKAEENYDRLAEQAQREYERERQEMRDRGMTDGEIDAWEKQTYWPDEDDGDDMDDGYGGKYGVEIDWMNGFAVVDGTRITFEELLEKMREDECIAGAHPNMEALQRFLKLAKAANMLKDGNPCITNVITERPSKDSGSAAVMIDILWTASFEKADIAILKRMMKYCDSIFTSGLKAGHTRFVFNVRSVWVN